MSRFRRDTLTAPAVLGCALTLLCASGSAYGGSGGVAIDPADSGAETTTVAPAPKVEQEKAPNAAAKGYGPYRKLAYGSRIMRRGHRGTDVRRLQRYLSHLGVPTTRDGAFGQETKRNVLAVEISRSWTPNGRVERKQALRIQRLARISPAAIPTSGSSFYLFGASVPAVTVSGPRPGAVSIGVFDAAGQTIIRLPGSLAQTAGWASATIAWHGRDSSGLPADDGIYSFEVEAGGATLSGGQTAPFSFHNAIFPLRADHDFGGAGSGFGAPRGDHAHQGQDVAAACGAQLVAAQGGTVVTRSYQAKGAGYYIVIKGAGSAMDYVYMHMQGKGPWSTGDVVRTGQEIGRVGSTGTSTGCHLHFERWTAPGWYQGGSPTDPLPPLLYWDSYS